MSANNVSSDKLKILCLHGYRQNAEVFKSKTGAFRKMVHKWAEFTFITAPHKVLHVYDLETDEIVAEQTVDTDQYGWFFNKDDHTFRGIRKGGPAIGFEESVQCVEEAFKLHGPFDGILGFSQGGCFTALLCDLQQRNLLNFSFNFVIIVSGFKSGSLPHQKYYEDLLYIPSLHIFGVNDNIIPTEMSAMVKDCFDDPVTVTHAGGHYFPATSTQKEPYQQFMKAQYLCKQDKNKYNLF